MLSGAKNSNFYANFRSSSSLNLRVKELLESVNICYPVAPFYDPPCRSRDRRELRICSSIIKTSGTFIVTGLLSISSELQMCGPFVNCSIVLGGFIVTVGSIRL